MLNKVEFQYRGVQVTVFRELFGWSFDFQYAQSQYFSPANYESSDVAKIEAKTYVDKILKIKEFDDSYGKY